MNSAKYAARLFKIRSQLARCTHISVFNMALNYLQTPLGAAPVSRMPWISMFLLKHALIQPSGRYPISQNEYQRIAQQIYGLQDCLVSNDPSEFMLSVRSMIHQQSWYQSEPHHILRASLFQRMLLERSFAHSDKLLRQKTGVGLHEYYIISDYLFALASQQDANKVIKHNLGHFYSHLAPVISPDVISNFLKLVSVPFEGMHDFLQRYKIEDSCVSEYLQETPFKNKPMIIQDDGFVIFNAGLLILGLKSIAFDILKPLAGFYDRFGLDVESYIGERLKLTNLQVIAEYELKKILSAKKKPISDFLAIDNDNVFVIESKAITPSDLMKCVSEPEHLYQMLRKSFLKGIIQGEFTALHMSKRPEFHEKRVRILIVTLDDFHIFGGKYIDEHFGGRLQDEIKAELGEVPVPMLDVMYLTLIDLVHLTEWLKGKPQGALTELMDDIERKQSEPHGARITVSHHIDETIRKDVCGTAGLEAISEATADKMAKVIAANQKFWGQQSPALFIHAFSQFRATLDV